MKKTVLIYGLIAGFIVGGVMLGTIPLWEKGIINFDNGEITGYTSMVIALSMVFFGIKSYRDNQLAGVISFGKAFQVGILITLVASVIYGLSWEISFSIRGDKFMVEMNEYYLAELKSEGATDAEMQKAKLEMDDFSVMYQNPLVRFPMTLVEILPVGLVITLISAGLLRRKEFLPSTNK